MSVVGAALLLFRMAMRFGGRADMSMVR
jgi:hypothetical protein